MPLRSARRPVSRTVDLLLGATLMYATLLGTGLQSPWSLETSRGVNANSGQVPLAARHDDRRLTGGGHHHSGRSIRGRLDDPAAPDALAGDVVDHLRNLKEPIAAFAQPAPRHLPARQQAEPSQRLLAADGSTTIPLMAAEWNYTTATVAACVRGYHATARCTTSSLLSLSAMPRQPAMPVMPTRVCSQPPKPSGLTMNDIAIGILTSERFLETRLASQQRTWLRQVRHVAFYSESVVASLPTIKLVPPAREELVGGGAWKNFPALIDLHDRFPEARWVFFCDDDTYVFIGNLIRTLSKVRAGLRQDLAC